MQKKILILVFLILTIKLFGFSQKKAWKTETTKDKMVVKSSISDTTVNGETLQLVEYVCNARVKASYEACVKVLKDVSLHKYIFEYTEKSDKIKELSSNEYLIYYFVDLPWPMPNSDSVIRMKFTTDTENQSTFFSMTAAPKMLKNKGVKRAQITTSTYTLKKINANEVSITATTYSVPTTKAPDWLASTWIPEGPAKIVRNIVKLSKK